MTWLSRLFGKRTARQRELVCVSYAKGDRMLRENVGWRLAPEEDSNNVLGCVWLERDAQTVSGESCGQHVTRRVSSWSFCSTNMRVGTLVPLSYDVYRIRCTEPTPAGHCPRVLPLLSV